MNEQLLNFHYVWIKDKDYRYVYVNENYAKAAGADSPSQMIGKKDNDMPWRDLAEDFQCGDFAVLQGSTRINSAEKTDTVNGITDILVTETQLLDSSNNIIGVQGSFIDITGKQLTRKNGYYNKEEQRYYLDSSDFGNTYLTAREMDVFKCILLGLSGVQISIKLNISGKTVDCHFKNLRYKLGAKHKHDLLTVAIRYGLSHLIDFDIS